MIRVGPAGWSYKDWAGIVYPAARPKGFQERTYISGFFNTVEINVTFYRPIPARTAESWINKVERNRRFNFTASSAGLHARPRCRSEDERLSRMAMRRSSKRADWERSSCNSHGPFETRTITGGMSRG